jgi:hypothetical protein
MHGGAFRLHVYFCDFLFTYLLYAVFLLYTHFLNAVVYMEREKCVCMFVWWIYLAREIGQWRTLLNTVMNPSSPLKDTEFIDWLQDF